MSDDYSVLELRLHGVNNTSPSGMLELPADAIEKVAGDSLGSFWRPRPEAQPKLKLTDPGRVPPGVLREAYSWGGMARNSIGGSSGVGKVISGAARVGWTLLLPFSLLNMAYWTRRLMKPTGEPSLTAVERKGWTDGGGAAITRLSALALTLLMAMTGCVIALDLVSVQCYADPQAPCSRLPTFMDFLASWDVSRRLALMSLIPLAAIALLYLLTVITKTRYAQTASSARAWLDGGHDVDASEATPTWPLLSTRGFWNPVRLLDLTAKLHLGAVAALIAAITAWHSALSSGSNCRTPSDLFREHCRTQVSDSGSRAVVELLVVVLGTVLLIGVAALIVAGSEDAPDIAANTINGRRGQLTMWAAAACGTLYVLQLGLLTLWRGPKLSVGEAVPSALLGISALPAILIALIIGFALAALTWRYVERRFPLVLGVAFAVSMLASSSDWWGGKAAWGFRFVAALAAIAVLVVVWRTAGGLTGGARRHEAWAGCAAGVFTILALLFAMLLSSAIVVAIGNVLNGRNSAASLAGGLRTPAKAVVSQCPQQCPVKAAPYLQVPRPYPWFGAALVPLLLGFLGLLAFVLFKTRASRTQIPETHGQAGSSSRAGAHSKRELSDYEPVEQAVRRARWFAALAHRAEKYVAVLAVLGALALILSLGVAVSGWAPRSGRHWDAVFGWALGAGMWAMALTGVAVIGLAAGGPATGNTRPLGLLWDLVCFLPKAAHPFGPPCYAERVVPELFARYQAWLTEQDGASSVPFATRRIVLSAHSLGSVLAVATIFSMASLRPDPDSTALAATPPEPSPIPAISVLSYGSQLRTYFGRIFPELLGPQVLGNKPCRASQLFSIDRWQNAIEDEASQGEVAPLPASLRAMLSDTPIATSRWINLWHRTDYLGFPVVQYIDSPLDRRAEEVDASGYVLEVLTHSDYPRTPTYREAFTDLTGL
jgi:hypothetical protein